MHIYYQKYKKEIKQHNYYKERIQVMFKSKTFKTAMNRYNKLNDKFELEAGVAIGLLVHNNAFDYAGDHYTFTRYGASGHFSMGLNYNLHDGQYIGFRATFPSFGSFLNDKPTLPTGLVATDKTQFSGYGLQVSYGIRF